MRSEVACKVMYSLAARAFVLRFGLDLRLCRRSGGEVLLLKRSSAHNDQKWGLPGGNVEEGDKDLIDTAKREATEEMGKLPPFDVKGELLTVYVSPWPTACGDACQCRRVEADMCTEVALLHVTVFWPFMNRWRPHDHAVMCWICAWTSRLACS